MNEPLRVVFDANVFVSGLLFRASPPGLALGRASSVGTILLSDEVFRELSDVLGRKKFDRYLTRQERAKALAVLLREAELVAVEKHVVACRDPKDDKYLSLAVAGFASVIVSGDRDLLELNPFQGVAIVTPAEFLDQIARMN